MVVWPMQQMSYGMFILLPLHIIRVPVNDLFFEVAVVAGKAGSRHIESEDAFFHFSSAAKSGSGAATKATIEPPNFFKE
jgi:hypothetical protein